MLSIIFLIKAKLDLIFSPGSFVVPAFKLDMRYVGS